MAMRFLALLWSLALPVAAAPLSGSDVEAVLTVRFVRELAQESAAACRQHGEPGGAVAQARLDNAWQGPLLGLGQRLDRIQASLPRAYLDGALQVQRQRLHITRSTAEELAAQSPARRKLLCDALPGGLVSIAIDPEPLLQQRGSSSVRLLTASDDDLAELAQRSARNLSRLTAPPPGATR
ncbi:hypothetical protein [Chitinimonas lacunae]|uniref:Uncharacterized protein n=1 Tax=Chitinimonas lacunae TaxID=1963018 RepID=A0ABV8MUX0_9NEIS